MWILLIFVINALTNRICALLNINDLCAALSSLVDINFLDHKIIRNASLVEARLDDERVNVRSWENGWVLPLLNNHFLVRDQPLNQYGSLEKGSSIFSSLCHIAACFGNILHLFLTYPRHESTQDDGFLIDVSSFNNSALSASETGHFN